MEINLEDFEKWVSPKILQRGREYFYGDALDSLEEAGNGQWLARVRGSQVYLVEISIQGNNLKGYDCECPVNDKICKHITAVLFEIRDRRMTNRSYSLHTQKDPEPTEIPLSKQEQQKLECARLIAQDNLEKAKDLALMAFAEYADQGITWMRFLLKIALKKDNTPDILIWAGELFPASGYSLDYYSLLKQHSQENWPLTVDVWLARIKSDDSGRLKKYNSTVAEILFRERRWKALRDHLFENRGNLDLIEGYRGSLLPEYPKEMLDLSAYALMVFASYSSGKLQYKRLAESLFKLGDIPGGQARSHELLAFFQKEHRKRPQLLAALRTRFS